MREEKRREGKRRTENIREHRSEDTIRDEQRREEKIREGRREERR